MSFSNRLKTVLRQAMTDDKAWAEFLGLFENAVGSVVASGEFTTAGGDTSETIPVTGALATDVAVVSIKTAGGIPVSIVAATAAADSIDVTTSADPSTDHVLSYIVFRAV